MATPSGAFALLTGFFAEDCSRHSFSIKYRRFKYVSHKRYNLMLPGIPKLDDTKFGYNIDYYVKLIDGITFPISPPNPDGPPRNYPLCRVEWVDDREGDYDGPDQSCFSWFLLVTGKLEHISIKINEYANMSTKLLNDQELKETVFNRWYICPHNTSPALTTDIFFKNKEKRKEYSIALHVDRDRQKTERLWNEMIDEHMIVAKALYEEACIVENTWKVDDPGSQRFGQLHPVEMTAREFYGKMYVPTYAGIHPNVYLTLKHVFDLHNLGNDVRRMLLNMILEFNVKQKMMDYAMII